MNERERIGFLELSLTRMLQWINAAEARIAVVLGLDTAMLGALAAFAPLLKTWMTATVIYAAVAVGCLVLSLIFIALATFPRMRRPEQSMVYFGAVAEFDPEQYLAAAKSLTAEQYIDDLARQCHRNAQIARAKFGHIRRGLFFLFVAIVPWALAILLLYQQRV